MSCGHHCGEAEKNDAGDKREGDERNVPIVSGVNFVALSEDIRKAFVFRGAIFRSAPALRASSKAAHKPSPSVDIPPVMKSKLSTIGDKRNRKISTKSDFYVNMMKTKGEHLLFRLKCIPQWVLNAGWVVLDNRYDGGSVRVKCQQSTFGVNRERTLATEDAREPISGREPDIRNSKIHDECIVSFRRRKKKLRRELGLIV
ncbi:hypothetical protein HED48_23600 [Ochrobactrum intermedium]|nr:hypothetical protein [Brucella intermedia]